MGAIEFIYPPPDQDCETCGGDGIDADPYGLFDFDIVKPCPNCKEEEPTP